jgi:alkylmercury lyase
MIGFRGLALPAMPHRLQVDGRTLHAWCAWDTLFLPQLIGKPAGVESTCPTTEQTIRLTVTPDGRLVNRAVFGAAPAAAT